MNLLEELTVIILSLFDFIMDLLTLGWWSRVRGEEKVIIKIRK